MILSSFSLQIMALIKALSALTYAGVPTTSGSARLVALKVRTTGHKLSYAVRWNQGARNHAGTNVY